MFQRLRTKILNGISNIVSDVGPLSFFSQWFNPNNLVGELEQLEKYTGITYACVSAIAEDVARIQFTLGRYDMAGNFKPVKQHPFLSLLNNPNPTQGAYPFWEMLQTHTELAGEAFIYVPKGQITSKPKELWLMRPDLVQVVYDQETAEVTGYIYHKWNGRVQVPLDLDEVIHHKMPNPINPYRGMGTVQAGIVYIQTEEYASRYSRNYLANNATPAGILTLNGTVPDDEFQKIKRQWTREYGNVENAGKMAILRKVDAEYTKVGSSLADIDLKELKNLTRDDIMFMFRVSKPILGITEDVNYANARTAEYVFAKRVIDPKMNRIIDTLQTFYNLKYKDGLVLGYVTPIPQDNQEKIDYLTAAVGGVDGVGWLTRNEARAMEKLPPIAGGDEILVPFNLIPITQADNSDGSSNAGQAEGAKAVKRKKIVLKAARPHSLRPEAKERFRLQLMRAATAYEPQIRHHINLVLADQKNKVLASLKSKRKRDLSDNVDYGTEATANDLVTQMLPVLMQLMQEAGRYALLLAGNDQLKYELTQEAQARIQQRVAQVAGEFSQETQDALVKVIKDGVDSGQTLDEMASAVEGVFSEATGYRAERLARTEAVHEANYAALDAYQQSGYVIKKEWYANPDACEFCQAMNGTVIDTQDVFVAKGDDVEGVDGGVFKADYQDVEAGDLHPNCRCTILPVVEEQ